MGKTNLCFAAVNELSVNREVWWRPLLSVYALSCNVNDNK